MHLTNTLLLTLPILTHAASRPKNAVLLSEVQSLTLRGNGAKTTHRRVSAIPQLKCVSPKKICDLYSIDVMRCTNQGSSYGDEDVEWSCTASLPEELKLGSTEVVCEGYASADDPYVLKGSCGVEYRMQLTGKGEQRFPDVANPTRRFFSDGEGGTDYSAWLFSAVFIAVLAWILYSACVAAGGNERPRRQAGGNRRGWGGGGGGGGGGFGPGGDPPPPYPGNKPSTSQEQGWRPGFWSGLAGGAAAGYYAGNRNNNQDRNRGWGSGGGSGWGGSNWGSGSSEAGPSTPRSSGASGSRHTSTGFGSTRRR